jgi:hypothetical protein
MSGGTMDYLFQRVSEEAARLLVSRNSTRRAFGRHLLLVADALHDIEWVDSGDYSDGGEIEAIMKVITRQDILKECIEQANEAKKNLEDCIRDVSNA